MSSYENIDLNWTSYQIFKKQDSFKGSLLGKRGWQNGAMLKFVPDCYKNQRMCNKAVNNYAHALQFVPNWLRRKKCVIKLLIQVLLQCKLIPDWCKTQPMCGKVAFKEPFMLKYCIDRHKTQ